MRTRAKKAKKGTAGSDGFGTILLGDEALQTGLRKGMRDIHEMREAEAAAANSVVPTAMGMAPRGATGNLAGSLQANAQGAGTISSPLPYAAPRHWGWAEQGMDESLFVLRAARSEEPRWLRYFKKEADKALAHAATGRP